MSEVLFAIVLVASITTALWMGGCVLHRFGIGYWPALFYGAVFAWWRTGKDSALTIAAALLDADEDCTEWLQSARLYGGLVHLGTGMEITRDFDGDISGLTVKGQSAEIDSWGWYCLVKARRAWDGRKAAIIAQQVNRNAAAAVQRAYGK